MSSNASLEGDIVKSEFALDNPFSSLDHNGDAGRQGARIPMDPETPRPERTSDSDDGQYIPFKNSADLLPLSSAHQTSLSGAMTTLRYPSSRDSWDDPVRSTSSQQREKQQEGDKHHGDPILAGPDGAGFDGDEDRDRVGRMPVAVSRTKLDVLIGDGIGDARSDGETRDKHKDRDGDKDKDNTQQQCTTTSRAAKPHFFQSPAAQQVLSSSLTVSTAPSSPTQYRFGGGVGAHRGVSQDEGQGQRWSPISASATAFGHGPTHRRSTISSGSPTSETLTFGYNHSHGHKHGPSVSSYINPDATGGIGNSPMPVSSILTGSRTEHDQGSGSGFATPRSKWRLMKEGKDRDGKDGKLGHRSSLTSLLAPTRGLFKKLSKLGLGSASAPASSTESVAGVGGASVLSVDRETTLRLQPPQLQSYLRLPSEARPRSISKPSLWIHLRKNKERNGEDGSLRSGSHHSRSRSHSSPHSPSNSQFQVQPQPQPQMQPQVLQQLQQPQHAFYNHTHPPVLTPSYAHSHSYSHSQSTSTSTAITSVGPSTIPTSTTMVSFNPSHSKPSTSSSLPARDRNTFKSSGNAPEDEEDGRVDASSHYDASISFPVGPDGDADSGDGGGGGSSGLVQVSSSVSSAYSGSMSSHSYANTNVSTSMSHQHRTQQQQQQWQDQQRLVLGQHPYAYAFDFPGDDNTEVDENKIGKAVTRQSNSHHHHHYHHRPKTSGDETGKEFGGRPWTWRRRLSPIPSGRSVRSVVGGQGGGDTGGGMVVNAMSTPDLRHAGVANGNEGGAGSGGDANLEGIDVSRLRPHVRARLASQGAHGGGGEKKGEGKGKERDTWLSTNSPYAILLPRPRFRVRTLDGGGQQQAPMQAQMGGRKRGVTIGALGGDHHHSGWEGGKTKGGSKEQASDKMRLLNRSYSRSLLDLIGAASGQVGQEGVKGGSGMAEFGVQRMGEVETTGNEARPKSYAHDDLALLSLERVLEEREKLEQDRKRWQTQAARSIGNKQSRIVSRSRSKSLTFVGRKMGGVKRHGQHQQSSLDYLAARACLGNQDISPLAVYDGGGMWLRQAQKEEAMKRLRPGSSGVATGGATDRSGTGHVRNDSWGQSALRLAKSLPQLCGLAQESEEQLKSQTGKQKQDGKMADDDPRPGEALRSGGTKVIKLTDPAASVGLRALDPSPVPSGASDNVVGIAISTPSEPAYLIPGHPYATDGDWSRYHYYPREEGSEVVSLQGQEQSSAAVPVRLVDHPYAQGGLPQGGYAGPHPISPSISTLASLGLSEVSARHRLPPQMVLGQQRLSTRQQGGDQQGQGQGQGQPEQRQQQQQWEPRPLYVKIDNRNSYQDLSPYVRVDSDVAPHEKLWVAYSPGIVREVLPNEVMQYSPRIEVKEVEVPARAAAGTNVGGVPTASRSAGQRREMGDEVDMFLWKYQRMSTVYQDTASMSEALADAMYDAIDGRVSMVVEPSHSVKNEAGVVDGGGAAREGEEERGSPGRDASQHASFPERYTLELGPVGQVGSDSGSRPAYSPPQLFPDHSPIEYRSTGTRSMSLTAGSKEASAYTSPVLPAVPFIGSLDNLEPFRDLFYKPPHDSEMDSVEEDVVYRQRRQGQQYQGIVEDVPLDVVGADGTVDGAAARSRAGSGLTALVQQLSDELEQMALEREREEQRTSSQYSQDSVSDVPTRTSSLATRYGQGSGNHINSETGPLHFAFGGVPLQEPGWRSYVLPRTGLFSAFQSENTIPEDVEPSQASSPEGSGEDVREDTVRYPIVTVEPSTSEVPQDQQTPRILRLGHQHRRNGEPAPQESHLSSSGDLELSPGGLVRSSYFTSSTLSHMSALSEFPSPPDTIQAPRPPFPLLGDDVLAATTEIHHSRHQNL
ncbi:hypothetical protein AX15_001948 [Amanita polypyramis BW_CC]|nr:hypothetical protein AX15_001948 [Amanita polypyramis BW_CC]